VRCLVHSRVKNHLATGGEHHARCRRLRA
jgi:hypothetical protein